MKSFCSPKGAGSTFKEPKTMAGFEASRQSFAGEEMIANGVHPPARGGSLACTCHVPFPCSHEIEFAVFTAAVCQTKAEAVQKSRHSHGGTTRASPHHDAMPDSGLHTVGQYGVHHVLSEVHSRPCRAQQKVRVQTSPLRWQGHRSSRHTSPLEPKLGAHVVRCLPPGANFSSPCSRNQGVLHGPIHIIQVLQKLAPSSIGGRASRRGW